MPTSAAVRATCSRGGVGYMGRERLEGGGLGRLGIGGRQVEGWRAGEGGASTGGAGNLCVLAAGDN